MLLWCDPGSLHVRHGGCVRLCRHSQHPQAARVWGGRDQPLDQVFGLFGFLVTFFTLKRTSFDFLFFGRGERDRERERVCVCGSLLFCDILLCIGAFCRSMMLGEMSFEYQPKTREIVSVAAERH